MPKYISYGCFSGWILMKKMERDQANFQGKITKVDGSTLCQNTLKKIKGEKIKKLGVICNIQILIKINL